MNPIVFYAAGGLAVAAAIATIAGRRAIRSALFLLGNILSLAVLFALLDAHLLAALQVIVYAGAVVVLFVFVIMLLGASSEVRGRHRAILARVLGTASLLYVGWVVVRILVGVRQQADLPEGFGTVQAIGRAMFTDNVLPFEAVSVLLLVAIVGAVAVAKGKRATRPGSVGAPQPEYADKELG